MKNTSRVFLAVVGLSLPASGLWAQTMAVTKTHSTGNQLMKQQVPRTQSPATITGGIPGFEAPKAASLLVLQKGSVLFLAGDSTLHKFEMGAKALFGSASLRVSSAAWKTEGGFSKALKAGEVESMELSLPVTCLKSKEKGLDDNAYKALKAKENPEIKFRLDLETLAPTGSDGKAIMTAKGKLTIAGETIPVTLTAEVEVTGQQIRLKGTQKIKMSDFKIKPPSISLVVTSIDVMDDIEVHYDVIFAANN